MSETILGTVGASLANLLSNVIDFLPQIILAFLLVILGFVVGDILGRAVTHFLNLLKVDKALDQLGLDEMSKRLGFGISLSKFVGQLVKWSMVIVFTMNATDLVGLRAFTVYLYKILNYLPSVLLAGIMLVAASAAGEIVKRLVDGSARAAGLHVRIAGNICKYVIIAFGAMYALSELNIASQFMETLFTGIVASASLALGLAFGLGGKDAAAKFLSKIAE